MGSVIGIILAGGIGRRFGGDKPKQYFLINGREMISYSIDTFRESNLIDDFVVVLNSEEFESRRIEQTYGVRTVCGGKTRNWSLKNALDYIANEWPDCEKIIENNAACPLTSAMTIDDYICKLDKYDWVQTTIRITDALGSYKDRTVNRDDYFLIQSPDAYRFKKLYNCFNPEHPNGHPAAQLPIDAKGLNVFQDGPVFKVTYPADVQIVEALMEK